MPEVTVAALREAAARYDARTDSFAQGKGTIARSLADYLEHHGRFASEKQAEFARKIIQWSVPRVWTPVDAPAETFPKVAAMVFGKGIRLDFGTFKVLKTRTTGSGWIAGAKFEDGVFAAFNADGTITGVRRPINAEQLTALRDVEARGVAALADIGRATGVCCVCSARLDDPVSVERGIGPVCESKVTGEPRRMPSRRRKSVAA